MWYSYKKLVNIIWKDRADKIFEWINKWKVNEVDEEKNYKDYINMTESEHSKLIHKRLVDKWITHNHSPGEAWLSWSNYVIISQARKKAEGTSKGYPDLHILIPYKEWLVNLFIELKKAPWVRWGMNWSKLSIEQAEWLNKLSRVPFNWTSLSQWSKQVFNLVDSMIDMLKDKTTKQVLELWESRDVIDYIVLCS